MRHFICTLLFLLLYAQIVQSGTTGKISGMVLDGNSEEPLAGVNITIDGLPMGASSDQDGYFYIINIPPGNYTLTAQYLGYQTVVKNEVFVRIDHTTEIEFQLMEKTLELSESIVVMAERPEVEKDVTSTFVNISKEDIDRLPVNSIADIISLQAGVVDDGGLHIRGGRSGEVTYLVDGNRIDDPLFGGSNVDINNEAIQQMALLTGTFNAEYGNAMSGVVNIVTKEDFGTLNGRVRYRMTNLGIESTSDLLNSRFLEGYISGALIPDLPLGIMISGKWQDRDNYYPSGTLTADQTGGVIPDFQSTGPAFGYNTLQSVLAKIYYRPIDKLKLTFMYNYNDREWQNYVHSYKYIPDSAYVRTSKNNLFALNLMHTISSDLFYEIRASYYTDDYLKNYGGLHYSQYSAEGSQRYQGEFRLSAGNEEYIDKKISTFTLHGDISSQINRYHMLKGGFEYRLHNLDYFWIFGPRRSATNQYINDFEKQPYEGAVYLQDKIEFDAVILNLGLRYDFYHPRVTYIADPNNPENSVTEATLKSQWSPRLGIAYPVSENTVFHFAFGQFFQRPTFEVLYEDLSRNMDVNKPLIGNPDLPPESTTSYELGVRTTLTRNSSMQATVFSKKIRNLIGVAWQFREPFVPLQFAYYTNEDFAYVKGFEIEVRWRTRNVRTGVNYSYQIAEGSSSSQQERFSGAYEAKGRQSLQFYPLSFDQRHIVNGNITFSFAKDQGPFDWAPPVFQNSHLSLIFRYGSGLPYTFNPTRKRYETDLNNARQPYTLFVDLDLEKRFFVGPVTLSLIFQVYNLLDRENVRSVYSFTGLPDDSGDPESYEYVANPLNYYPPRSIYLGFGIGF